MADVIALFLDTLSFTLTLLLVTLGLVVIFGMMNVINMAHGEFFLLGAYVVVVVTGRALGSSSAPIPQAAAARATRHATAAVRSRSRRALRITNPPPHRSSRVGAGRGVRR